MSRRPVDNKHVLHVGRVASAMNDAGLRATILLNDDGSMSDTLRIRFPFAPHSTDVIVPPPSEDAS